MNCTEKFIPTMTDCDVLVVGAGPVGALAALLLARRGHRVIIIDREATISDSPRAVVYLPQSLGSLKEAGILGDLRARGLIPSTGPGWRYVSDHKVVAELDPFALKLEDNPQPAILLGQDLLIEIIAKHLRECGVEIQFNHELRGLRQENDKVIVTTDTTEFTASFVIGADGARSGVRKALNIDFEGFTHPINFMAVNFRYSDIQATGFNEAQFIMDPKEKIEDANFAIILRTGIGDVWRCAYGDAGTLSDEEMKARLPQKLKAILPLHPDPSQYEVLQAQRYRIHQRCASSFVQGRVLLAGDAAHVNNPVGGMGLNTGLLDAHAASAAILRTYAGEPVEKELSGYDTVRRGVFTEFVNPMTIDNLRRLWEKSEEADGKLRNGFFGMLNNSKDFQRMAQLSMNKMAQGVPGY